jgi:uncharacterized protein
MSAFGAGFIRGRSTYQYAATSGQNAILAAVLVAVLFGLYSVLQFVAGALVHVVIYGAIPNFANPETLQQSGFIKSLVIGIFPAAVLAVGLTFWASRWWNRTGERGLPLHNPMLGVLGWIAILLGFIVAMYGVFTLTFFVLGIDPTTYMPSRDGLNDTASQAGMIEKILADMSDEPLLFALAVPSIALAGPIVEELVFRGAVFAALRQTRIGTIGAAIFTSAVWAVVHGSTAPWLFVGLLFIMGLVLVWLLLRFGSLWVPIVCHCVWNGIVTLSFFAGAGTT